MKVGKEHINVARVRKIGQEGELCVALNNTETVNNNQKTYLKFSFGTCATNNIHDMIPNIMGESKTPDYTQIGFQLKPVIFLV